MFQGRNQLSLSPIIVESIVTVIWAQVLIGAYLLFYCSGRCLNTFEDLGPSASSLILETKILCCTNRSKSAPRIGAGIILAPIRHLNEARFSKEFSQKFPPPSRSH